MLHSVRCFLAVARYGSITAAAKTMNVSQPSLGVQIRNIEVRYGVTLFERHGRGTALTQAGRSFLPQAEALAAEADRTEAVLRSLDATRPQTLTFGITPTAEVTLAVEILNRCAAAWPKLNLLFEPGFSDNLCRRVHEGLIDAALCYANAPGGSGTARPLYSEDLYLVGQPALLGRGQTIAFKELARLPLMLDRRLRVLRTLIDDTAHALKVVLHVEREVEPIDVKRALIRRQAAFTIVPYGLFIDEIRSGAMAARRIVRPALERTLFLMTRPGLPEPEATALAGWSIDSVGAVVAEGRLRWRKPR